MTDRPILFTGDMVRAIMEGRKKQTRRLSGLEVINKDPNRYKFLGITSVLEVPHFAFHDEQSGQQVLVKYKYGKPGDRLWVRETWARMCKVADPFCCCSDDAAKQNHYIEYRADTGNPYPGDWPKESKDDEGCPRWKSSRFMPYVAARLVVMIINVRVERLQHINGGDAVLEGISIPAHIPADGADLDYARKHYSLLWNSLNAQRNYGWDANPWVWVIEFILLHGTWAGKDD